MSRVVPVQSDVNATRPLFAALGSGGGGSGSPNPSFSSIIMSPSFLNDGGIGSIQFTQNTPDSSAYIQLYNPTISPIFSTLIYQSETLSVRAGDSNGNGYTKLAAGAYIVTGLNDGLTFGAGSYNPAISVEGINGGTNSQLDIDGGGVSSIISLQSLTSISSLNVSSINGAAPGGGGAANPNPIVSSLTLGFPGGGPPAPLLVQHNSSTDPGNYTTLQADVLNYSSSINNRIDPVIYVSTGASRVPGNLGTGLLVLGDTSSTQGYFTDNPYLTNINSTLQLVATTDVVIPKNLVVSSINGAAPALASTTSTLQGQMLEVRSTLGLI